MQTQPSTHKRPAGAFLVPALMAGFALVYAYANRNVPPADMRLVTPATIALVAVSALLMLRLWLTGSGPRPAFSLNALRRPLGLVLSTLILLFGAGYDFPISGILFLALSMLVLGVRRPLIVLCVALIVPILLFIAFTSLGVPLTSFWLKL